MTERRPDAIERVLEFMNECEACTGYGDPETVRIFRGVTKRIREAVYGSEYATPSDPSEVLLEFRQRINALPHPHFEEGELTPEAENYLKRALCDLEAARVNTERARVSERLRELQAIRAAKEGEQS